MTNKYFLIIALLCISLIVINSNRINAQDNLTITKNGCSNYTIILSNEASPSEKFAVKELQKFLKIISGVTIPIYRDNEKISGPLILVGDGILLRQIDDSINYKDLGPEGFVIRTKGQNIILAGGRQRGTMYSIFHFLKQLGCRWYTPEVSHIPQMSTISISPMNITEKPAFVQRMMNWTCARDADWAVRNFQNSAQPLGKERGGTVEYIGGHSYFQLVQPKLYFKDHPEYYSLLNGKRQWEYAQLCTTNPEVAKIAALSVMEWIKRTPNGVAYNVGQEDWRNFCVCGHCAAINEREESAAGSNIYLVNAIGKIVEKVYPDKNVGTFAYSYTEKPPKYLHTADNVAIRLAIIVGCDAHPLELCPQNAQVAKNVKDWAAVNDHIYIWDYTNDFTHLLQPFPNWWACQEDLRLFKRVGIDGVFLQGNSFTEAGAFSEMQAFIQAQMLWNPDQDIFDLIDDFLNGYYGPAAPSMRRFVDLLQNKVRNLDNHFRLFSPPTEAYLAPEIIKESEKIFDEAERAAQGRPDIQFLVEESRMMLRYVKLTQNIEHKLDGENYKPDFTKCPYPNIDIRELYDFMETCNDHHITALDEWGQMETRYNHMLVNVATHTLVPVENENLKLQFVPTIGGRIFSIQDKKTGKDLLFEPQINETRYSTLGGFKDGPAQNEIFDYKLQKESDGQRIILQTFLSVNSHGRVHNSFLMTRDILLPAGKSEITVATKMKALQPIDRPQAISPSPVFKLGNANDIQVGIVDENGNFAFSPLPAPPDERGNVTKSFRGREIRTGVCYLVNKKDNIGIAVNFDPSQVMTCTIVVNPQYNVVAMGLQGNQVTYTTDDEVTMKYKYTFLNDIKNIVK